MASYILVKIGLLVAVVAFLTQIISLSIPWWTYRQADILGLTYFYHSGLWTDCVKLDTSVGQATSCSDIVNAPDWLFATRALEILGMLLILLAAIVGFIHLIYMTDIPLMAITAALIILVAGLLIWIGALVFGYRYVETDGHESGDFHAGWGLAMAASLLCHLSGVLLVVGKICGYD